MARETLSRQFRALYEVSAAGYRVEARARRAWSALVVSSVSLASLAHACGYADQAHLTRDVGRADWSHPGRVAPRTVTNLQDARLTRVQIGIDLQLAHERSDSLVAPIIAHGVRNAVEVGLVMNYGVTGAG